MEFWGVEVPAGKPLKVIPEENFTIHMTQAALGESECKAESVHLKVESGEQKVVIGILSDRKSPQTSLQWVFDKEFELSHDWNDGSVFFCGYKWKIPEEESDKEEEEVLASVENDKSKIEAQNAKPNGKASESMKVDESNDSDSEETYDSNVIYSDEPDDSNSEESDDENEDYYDDSDEIDNEESNYSDDEMTDESSDEKTHVKVLPSSMMSSDRALQSPPKTKDPAK